MFLIHKIIIVILTIIIITLGYGLFFLVNSQAAHNDRLVKTLTIRITLSVILFLLIISAYLFGIITPNI